jgi:tRNA (cytidine/uridine-2'-O-)-methyltransferase
MFNIVLFQPEIPPNTGNIIRLTANTGCALHLIEPLGFSMDDKQMRRAGLDYHEYAEVKKYSNWETFLKEANPQESRLFALSTHGDRNLFEQTFQAGDWFLFGCETSGLPSALRNSFLPNRLLRLPLIKGQRSLNLSNTVAVVAFEAWRQLDFATP